MPNIPTRPPDTPFIYIDWNSVQHLQGVPAFSPLLLALIEARMSGSALLPYSRGHLMDATAGWNQLKPEFRAERIRHLTFLNGLSSEWFWEFREGPRGQPNALDVIPCVEACRSMGYLISLMDDVVSPWEHRSISPKAAVEIRAQMSNMRAALATAPNVAPDMLDGLVNAMEATIEHGVPELWDIGAQYTSMLAPIAKFVAEPFCNFDGVPPDQAISFIDQSIQRHAPDMSFEKIIKMYLPKAASGSVEVHRDELGPMLIGLLGYHRDRAKDYRRSAPGMIADQTHSRYALASAIFITSEVRLPRRIEAWAALTGRGQTHGTWPIILSVGPDDLDSIQTATDVVLAYAKLYHGRTESIFENGRSRQAEEASKNGNRASRRLGRRRHD